MVGMHLKFKLYQVVVGSNLGFAFHTGGSAAAERSFEEGSWDTLHLSDFKFSSVVLTL